MNCFQDQLNAAPKSRVTDAPPPPPAAAPPPAGRRLIAGGLLRRIPLAVGSLPPARSLRSVAHAPVLLGWTNRRHLSEQGCVGGGIVRHREQAGSLLFGTGGVQSTTVKFAGSDLKIVRRRSIEAGLCGGGGAPQARARAKHRVDRTDPRPVMLKNMKVGTKLHRRSGRAGPGAADPGRHRRQPAAEHGQQHPAGRAAGPDGGGRTPTWPTTCSGRPSTPRPTWPARGTQWKSDLATQRTATDAAIDTYKTTVNQVNPQQGVGRPGQGRRRGQRRASATSPTQRNSVDGLETPAPTAISQFDAASHGAGQVQQRPGPGGQRPDPVPRPHHLRQPQRLQGGHGQPGRPGRRLVQVGQFPKTWPGAGQSAVPCDVVSTSGCEMFGDLTVASGDSDNA